MIRWRRTVAWLLMCVLLLTATIPSGTAAAYRVGDVDRDGVCGTADVRCLLRLLIDPSAADDEQCVLADYDADGEMTSSDARAILFAVLNGSQDNDPMLMLAAAYSGEPFAVLHNNLPLFTDAEKQDTTVFELYSPLDTLGRCGTAYANLCRELMPTEDRESISSVTPTGWHNRQYDFVSGGWVYNRCHIIGFQLAGEQANKQNLITGTRYLNIEGMLPFENMIADYIKETDNHVLYRATPIFIGDNLLCEGVQIEAWSVEDNGEGICFHVFCYNVQPGVIFDYTTGENSAADSDPTDEPIVEILYILNTNSKKFHLPTCASAASISDKYRQEFTGDRENLIQDGYSPCGNCKP